MIRCGMAVKKTGISVGKMKAMSVKRETLTLIGKGRYNLTCFVY